jgi:carboxymethylenebutenolidase
LSGSDDALSRRELLVAGALAAGYALAAGPVRADVIVTSAEGLVAGDVSIETPDGALSAYRARPEGSGPFPVVIVVHEIFGVHEYVRDVCRRLAREGHLAVAPDLFARQGDVSRLESIDAILREVVSRVPDAQVMADLDACAAWAQRNAGAPGRVAVVGFCWGGRIVWLYAAHRPDDARGVAWYGRLTGEAREGTPRHPYDLAAEPLAPVLGLYGGRDRGIPLETVFAMRKRLAEENRSSEILIFPEAPHGFHADYRSSYRPEDAREAWRRMLEWLAREQEPED